MTFLYIKLLFVYKKANIRNRKVIRIFLELFRRLLIWLGDPFFVVQIHGKDMIIPVSHKLPIYTIDFPLYDTLPSRVAQYLRIRDTTFTMVDVGANIGDTILSCSGDINDKFLGVEANPEFVPYLKQNMRNLENFVLVEAFCHSENEKQVHIRIDSAGGTASLLESNSGVSVPKKTLDQILIEHSEFKDFNFLKIDTDGNDFEILKGSQKSLVVNLPIILIECDVFGNTNYVDDVINSIDSLASLGYSRVIAYDNFGNYFCAFSAKDATLFLNAIAYQIISEFGYYDLLFLSEKDIRFIQSENEFFLNYVRKKNLSTILQKALQV